VTVSQPGEILVEDPLERRIRKPVDLLRCVVSCIEIAALALAGVAASATTAAVQADIAGATRQVPASLLAVARPLALIALYLLPVALAVQILARRQFRRLAESVATGALAAAVTAIVNELLSREPASRLYDAITMARPGTSPGISHIPALDPALAGLVAYATMIGLVGRPAWRNALWVAVGVYSVVHVGVLHTPLLTLLITVIAGRAIGLAVRYVAGSTSERPGALAIASALRAAGLPVRAISRVRPDATSVAGSRHYAVTAADDTLDVVVFDRDQQAAGAFYRIYRSVRVLGQVSHSAPLSVERVVEHRSLLSYAAEDAGAPTPRLRALVRVGPEAAVLAYEHYDGTTLAKRNPGCSDEELNRLWEAVSKLHARRVTHRGLTADRILLTDDGQVMLLDPGDGDVAASDLQIRLDVAQLIAELALYVGPDRAAGLALKQAGVDELAAVVPLLQPVALARSTRKALRGNRAVLPALRSKLLAAAPGVEVAPVRLERIRLRTVVTMVASAAAVYLLAGELARASLGSTLREANWQWVIVALALSASTYVGATISLSGFVADRLPFSRTLLAQLAGSFVTLVTPAAVGGAALNIRYLQRRKIPAPVAAASVGVAQVVAFVLHIVLIVIFAAIAGSSAKEHIQPPRWAWFVLAGLVVLALAALAIPAGRRVLRARLSPTLGQVLPRLLEVAQQPRKLALGIGGALLLSLSYILCLAACVAAFGRSVPIVGVAVVYLTGSAIGSILPTPGGLGGVEAALTDGLTAAGLPGAVAVSAVLVFRLITFWLPVPFGWAAFSYLERQQAVLPPDALPGRRCYVTVTSPQWRGSVKERGRTTQARAPTEHDISRFLRLTRTAAFYLVTFLVVTAGSIWLALQVAPLQTVSAAGQTAQVGAAASDLSFSGPGELDLFGQVVPTKPRFSGPIRPLLKLTHITIDDEVARVLRSDSPRTLELNLSQQLAQGWTHYFEWETLIAVGFAVVALLAVAGLARQSRKTMAKTVIAGLAVVTAVNVGGVLLTASSTPAVLRSVKTLDDLVGADPLTAPQQAATRPLPGVQAVVIGDSTATAVGNLYLRSGTPLDRACGRSSESYAADLAAVNNWNVLNLACSGATVQNGLLGAQVLGNGQVAPPQLAEAQRATHAKVIIVSIGADDVEWSIMTRLCAASTVCNDKASGAFFSKQIGDFTRSYYELLGDLARLPGAPAVLVNQYYSPFGADVRCLARYGITPTKGKVLASRLQQLNAVLAQGAQTFGFGFTDPPFTGHELCTADPWVEGPDDPAPLHPTAAGELAIALADQQALPKVQGLVPAPSPTPTLSAGQE
jgi:glycosyltransferase 2 family protein